MPPTDELVAYFVQSIRVPSDWWRCFDCHEMGGEYMVHNHVWYTALPPQYEHQIRSKLLTAARANSVCSLAHRPTGIPLRLCLRCLEKRLGRKLLLTDFTDAPINNSVRFGFAMGAASKHR
jgi:hypothetical protein